ncbi:Tripartite tricarboxylate transporter TctA family protein [Thalassovita gelatinovora]|uniref:Tripartite tricarboxylate transporter TctA family protein n=1 Tax=Thalassovita gelatinovora TaxID=53501 RepID=A0A0P1F918_THAGE|nr:tripartite tricarboxylate transporter permease [Thalassovita gelatinovora]QIZ81319.1 tripartite tricarboxylate transporter permease [Thalassovita gelatinovora]CUH64511.1 Tripartite tricarboxylate transporter TctA family protein [Thalassovita gelatinovora]SEP97172.1 putative tricarboxylic transport membrane protein [Thalassovita gelatinovora]
MEILFAAMEVLARWDVALALIAGSIGGVAIGAIPGVGPAVAIAILLPATFSMDPIVGLTVLLGIYGSSMYGGAIPAILINTPGTAVNALTTYDGYPMTLRGEARRALSLAYSSSFFGGVFSVVCLILLSPVLAKVAPMFGSREIFLAALLGVILVIVAHRGQMLIAAALTGFGIFLSTVGLEPVKYSRRFTFEQSWLASGVDLIVVVLGLFALSQAFVLLTMDDEKVHIAKSRGSLFQGFRELARHPRVAAVSAGFGVLMGMIPGVGEFTAQFMSYTSARKLSKTPQAFGRGSSEGLIASETANNAVPAAAMIPLLALGIPGEALTAMMLSVFYVHNVVPGPGLFQFQMDFVVALYLALLILNVLVVGFLLVSTGWLVYLTKIPNRFLGMCILLLSFVGVYSIRNSAVDCGVAAVFGLIGFVLKRLNLPIVPIVLGMVLGGIMEVKLRASMNRVKTPLDFIDRPIALLLFCVIVVVLGSTLWRVWREWTPVDRRSNAKKASVHFTKRIAGRKTRHFETRTKKQRRKRSYDHLGS